MTFAIGVAQLNPLLGDVQGNARLIAEAARSAHARGMRLLLTPELSLCSPAAQDLLLRPAFVAACDDALRQLILQSAADWPGLLLVLGHPLQAVDGRLQLAVSALADGRLLATATCRSLASGAGSDMARHFVPGDGPCAFDFAGMRLGLMTGADALDPDLARGLREAGARLLLAAAAWPFEPGGLQRSEQGLAESARAAALPLLCAQPAGGLDEQVYAGASLALAADGSPAARAASFEAGLLACQIDRRESPWAVQGAQAPWPDADAQLWHALVLGLRDYVEKNGFASVALGLSGGMDSALVAVLAVDALGPERVHAFMLSGPYTADISLEDARELAARLGVAYQALALAPALDALEAMLQPLFAGKPADTTEENLQARIRGLMLMALSNKHGHLILACGNKSEYAVGYSTLYGDMCGGFAPIRDVYKTVVYRLARWRNAHDPFARGPAPIPERIITRPPSAELREDQRDDDSLPAYEVLDALLQAHVGDGLDGPALVDRGFDPDLVARITRLVRLGEYKRRQAAPGTRVTARSLGGDWRYPVSSKFTLTLEPRS